MLSFKSLILVLALGALTACGFEPLYSRKAPVNASAEMASIRILPIEDRIGQIMQNHLLDLLNPHGRPRKPRYTLEIKLSESSGNIAVSKESFATRANYTLSATFTVFDSVTKKNAIGGTERVVTSYNILESDYATQVAENDARDNALRQAAFNIQNQIAALFKTRSQETASDSGQVKN